MAIPHRGSTGHGTYFVTSNTNGKRRLLQSERSAKLLIEVLLDYRAQRKYWLHEFVIMADHFHLLITSRENVTLERAIQFIKGGYSYRFRKHFGGLHEIWQTSFHDHRVRNYAEYDTFRAYIFENPVKRGLCKSPEEYPYSSIKLTLDEVPQWLKPEIKSASSSQA